MRSDRPIVHVVPAEPWGGIQALVPMLASEQVRQGRNVQLLFLGSGTRIRDVAQGYGLGAVSHSVGGDLLRPLRLWVRLRRARGAIIHSHCEPVWAAATIALATRGRWIEHAHVYMDGVRSPKVRLWRWLQQHFATRHIAISHSIGRALIASGIAVPATLDVVHNGVAVDAAVPVRDRAPRPYTLGFVGRVVEEKGIYDFIDLVAALADSDLAFAVYGDGANLAAARARASGLGVADRIVFHGHVADIAAAWGRIDVAAVFSHREPFGLVFLEAALHGVPTISYANDSGGAEVAATLRSAYRVPAGDVSAAAAVVRTLATDPDASRAALAHDRTTVAERFGIAAMATGVAHAYRKLDHDDDGVTSPGKTRA